MPTDNLPSDIDPESRCRVPLADRSKLTGEAAEMYDQHVSGESKSLKGLFGPGGIRLHSPCLSAAGRAQARYLRHEAGIDGDLRELAILIAAREADSNFEWSAHEGVGRAEGLPEDVIEAVRLRTSVDGLAEKYAALILLGRAMFTDHEVSAETFKTAHDIFGSELLVDLVSLMGNYVGTAGLLACFGMQLPDGEEPRLPKVSK